MFRKFNLHSKALGIVAVVVSIFAFKAAEFTVNMLMFYGIVAINASSSSVFSHNLFIII